MFAGESLGYFCVVGWFLLFSMYCSIHFLLLFLQWIIWLSQGIGRWLSLLVSEGTVASFAAASAFSFPW